MNGLFKNGVQTEGSIEERKFTFSRSFSIFFDLEVSLGIAVSSSFWMYSVEWNPASDDKANILKDVIGPSGNLRAPTWRIGNEFIVGFNPELYEEVFG